MSKPQWSPEGPSFGSDTKMLPRRPKCVRCRNHDLLVPIKGHARKCPFYLCQCWKCALNSERTRIATIQRSLKRKQQAEQPLERAARLHNSGTFGGFPDVDCMSISSDPKHRPTILDSGGGKLGSTLRWERGTLGWALLHHTVYEVAAKTPEMCVRYFIIIIIIIIIINASTFHFDSRSPSYTLFNHKDIFFL
uniref:DM domain-containing protein n=1 Tax=Erpetoichthys calabaricus TaxID=27687 RepID=A0A8C4S5U0_ERPCA